MAEYGRRYRTPEPGGKMVGITQDNDVDFSGNYALTVTLTGTTGVTLPTTGTLATRAGAETLTNKTLTSPALTTPVLSTATPASAGAAGVAGTIVWDASYIYVCTATNTWKRVAIATW